MSVNLEIQNLDDIKMEESYDYPSKFQRSSKRLKTDILDLNTKRSTVILESNYSSNQPL